MIRTQIYLPEEIHEMLLRLAQAQGTSISKLIRRGAANVIRENYGKLTPQKKALKFFASPSPKYKVNFTKSASQLVRQERD